MTIKNLWQYLEKTVTHYWSQFFTANLAFIIAQPFTPSPFVENSSSDWLKVKKLTKGRQNHGVGWGHLPFQIQVAGVVLEANTVSSKDLQDFQTYRRPWNRNFSSCQTMTRKSTYVLEFEKVFNFTFYLQGH